MNGFDTHFVYSLKVNYQKIRCQVPLLDEYTISLLIIDNVYILIFVMWMWTCVYQYNPY